MVYVKRILNLPVHLMATVLPTIIFAIMTMIALMDPMKDWIIAVGEITIHKKDTVLIISSVQRIRGAPVELAWARKKYIMCLFLYTVKP